MKTKRILGIAAGLIAFGLSVYGIFKVAREDMSEPYEMEDLRCALALGRISPARGLVAGYSYDLLETFAIHNDVEIEIMSVGRDTSVLDSLRRNLLDVVVMRTDSTLSLGDSLHIIELDEMTSWVINSSHSPKVNAFEQWIEGYLGSYEDSLRREIYYYNYNPRRSARASERPDMLSPYDSIIKIEADRIGWDWRMLASVIWQESRFDINARSPRGALGLMQMMPHTARHFDVADEIDPGRCIHAGAEYLLRLQRMFGKRAKNADELHKLTLAAYNAGQGRILKCIEFADEADRYDGTWQSIVDCIPDIEDFKGVETTAYVEQILSTYQYMCKIAK